MPVLTNPSQCDRKVKVDPVELYFSHRLWFLDVKEGLGFSNRGYNNLARSQRSKFKAEFNIQKGIKNMNFCRCCRYYKPEGQRGGCCQLLDVPVKGGWRACSLAISPFDCSFPTTCEPRDRCEVRSSADRWQRSTVEIPGLQPVLAGC